MSVAPATKTAINNKDQFEILRRYSSGSDIVAIVAETGLAHDLVAGTVSMLANFQRGVAGRLVDDYMRRRPVAVPAFSGAPRLTTVPATVPQPEPEPEPEPTAAEDPLADLLDAAGRAGDAKLTRLVDKARALVDDIRGRYAEIEQERQAREAAERVRAEALAEVERLAAELAAARARAREVTAIRPRAAGTVSPPRVSTGRTGQIRAWAAKNGYHVAAKGVIGRNIVEAYEEATGDREVVSGG